MIKTSYYLNLRAEKEFLKSLGTKETDPLRMKLVTEKGKVVSLLVQYETYIEDQWRAIVRYNTAHGFPHRDVIHPNGGEEKFSLSFPDLKTALQYAEQDIKD
ncbi:MAG: hypothetical protein ACE5OR_04640 [bacterium]